MVRLSFTLAAFAALAPYAAAQCPGVTGRLQPKMAAGYRYSLLASGAGRPRHIVVDSEDNLLVTEQQGGSVSRYVLSDNGENVCSTQKTTVVRGTTNHGIQLSKDGKTLFVSNLNTVTAYDYDATTGTASNEKTLITGMNMGGTPHPTRAILVSKFDPDKLLVTIGSFDNVDGATIAQSSNRCMIKVFSISKLMQSTANWRTEGEILGWGLRNLVGMTEDPLYGGIWSVENSMDSITLGGRDVHNDNPAEKLNYHGALNDTNNPVFGANFGYPACLAAWDTQSLGGRYSVGQLFHPEMAGAGGQQANTDFAANGCDGRQLPTSVFPSHTAPLDIKFTKDSSVAYISFHGSWNRNPPDGYRVMKVNFKDGKPVEPLESKNAAIPVMENPNVGQCSGFGGSNCFRPVGLDFDSKGRLFMSSDATNEIYVIYGAET